MVQDIPTRRRCSIYLRVGSVTAVNHVTIRGKADDRRVLIRPPIVRLVVHAISPVRVTVVVVVAAFARMTAASVTLAHLPDYVIRVVKARVNGHSIDGHANSTRNRQTNAQIHAAVFARAQAAGKQGAAVLGRKCW